MFKPLIISTIISFITLGISYYFNFNSYMYFIMGIVTYGIYDFISDIKIKVE